MKFILKHIELTDAARWQERTVHGECNGLRTMFFTWMVDEDGLTCLFRVTRINFAALWDYMKYRDAHIAKATLERMVNEDAAIKMYMPFDRYYKAVKSGAV